MDKIDEKILEILRKDSKLSYRKIASKVGVSGVTALKRIGKLKKEGIIKSYGVKLDYERLGYEFNAVIRIRIGCGKYDELEKVLKMKGVFAAYDIVGDFDVMLIVKFQSRRALNDFLKRIQKFSFVERTETSLILNSLKE